MQTVSTNAGSCAGEDPGAPRADGAGPGAPRVKLDEIFQDLFKVSPDSLKDEATMADIELWDSLKHMELIVAIEQKFEIELTFEEISEMQSIGAIRRIVLSRCPS